VKRPTYENDATLKAERDLIDRVSERWNFTAHKNPKSYRVDFSLTRQDKIVAFAEAKCRQFPSSRYPTYLLSLAKYMAMCEIARMTDTKAFLLVQWTDRIGFVFFPCPFELEMGGRTDRNDPDDIEPVVLIDLKEFLWFQST
jgi:hypothetical protein